MPKEKACPRLNCLPEKYQVWLQLNPLTFAWKNGARFQCSANYPILAGLAIYRTASGVMASLERGWFQKARKGFAGAL